MSHPLLKAAIRFFFIALLLILPAQIASACSCLPRPTVLEAYEAADEVLIVRVLSIQTSKEPPPAYQYFDNSRSAIARIDRVYKGTANTGEQLTLGQGGGRSCNRLFDNETIDKEFLLYLKTPEKPNDLRQVSFCGRSNMLEYAREDLLYLDNQEELRGKTRVSGLYFGMQYSLLDAANRKIQIFGSEKVYETHTDEKGVFEIYDLPPGKYRIEPEIPTGWKLYGWYPRSTTRVREGSMPGESGHFVLEPKKHASINIMFRPDSSIAGTVVGPNGNPLPSICARLMKPDRDYGESASACTNEKGQFLFDAVVPGTYFVVLNPDDQISSEEPFPRLFYPGSSRREKAVPIEVAVGEKVKDINIVVPEMFEIVTVEGVLYFSNNRPAKKLEVLFRPTTATRGVSGIFVAQTDANGRFLLKVLKGLAGTVHGEVLAYAGMFENCPAFDALFKDSSQTSIWINTQPIRIEAEHDIRDLVLRLPFPKCKPKN